ncbi:MAG: hypothetical protein L6Q34_00435 [Nitrospira sp.]|nr:MAG: hypothetical protein UZ03_NOB001003415 [Nitrospira sp. OLB3]MCE7965195.1 hypothetical protein [Nitrospira sp. NTP2]MCK6491877.1 hypothetical protein [Nitrospira sp.]MEB2340043.1 hypothetical protein [Nitrospirales bacterium]RIK60696.1 MAG: hypothetical protein DCC63_03440 [Nitrospira sp.]
MMSIWELFSQDVALFGSLHSPLLSWLGSCGLVIFFLWHVGRLTSAVSSVQSCYTRVWPILNALAAARKGLQSQWLTIPALSDSKRPAQQPGSQADRIDLDDLQALDKALRREPRLEQAWLRFRKTFVIERTAWFIEPRVFATRSAAEFFPRDLLQSRLNLAFYHQFPSLITGLGLLLTFLAILIGLSKLHADGSHIVGIQGLINSLAGKFLTSIVGLICANLFVLVEKSVLHRLATTQQQFATVLDELFPRKTMEQMLENFTPGHGSGVGPTSNPVLVPGSPDLGDRLAGALSDRLSPTVTALREAVEVLSRREGGVRSVVPDRLAEELSRVMQETMAGPIQELNQAIQTLARSVEDLKRERRATDVVEAAGPTPEEAAVKAGFDEEEPAPEAGMVGLRWFANWRQGTEMKGVI